MLAHSTSYTPSRYCFGWSGSAPSLGGPSYGADWHGDALPAELALREGRLAAIRQAKAGLATEHRTKARAAAELVATGRGADPEQTTAAGDVAEPAAVVPAKAQRSCTGPDAPTMKTSDGSFHSCHNSQDFVDEHSQMILGWELRNSGADYPAPPDMLTALEAALAAAGWAAYLKRCWPMPVISRPTTSPPSTRPGSIRCSRPAGLPAARNPPRRETPSSATGPNPEQGRPSSG